MLGISVVDTESYDSWPVFLKGIGARGMDGVQLVTSDALAYLDFPKLHWKRLRTNNVQERTYREIKRRSRVVRVFPSVESLTRLVGAVMCE